LVQALVALLLVLREAGGPWADGQLPAQDLGRNGVAPAAHPLGDHPGTALPPGALVVPALVRRLVVQNVEADVLALRTALLGIVPHGLRALELLVLVAFPHGGEGLAGFFPRLSAGILRNPGVHATRIARMRTVLLAARSNWRVCRAAGSSLHHPALGHHTLGT